ncbi:MAG: hypothetical protein ACJ776_04390 [Chloroflexota bacterium]|jgi:hypothetical protein
MDAFIMLVAVIAALALFAGFAARFGVDSRVDSTDPRSPAYPVGITS